MLADRDAFQGQRSGNASYLRYGLFNQNYSSNGGDFHEISVFWQPTNPIGY